MCYQLPDISKCCCCMSLRIGAYLIGILQLIFGLSVIIMRVKGNIDFFFIIGFVSILLALMLLLAIEMASRNKNLLLLKVYIVLEMLRLVVGFGITIMLIIVVHSFGVITRSMTIITIAVVIAMIALNASFLVCINLYLMELIKQETSSATAATAVVYATGATETHENNMKE